MAISGNEERSLFFFAFAESNGVTNKTTTIKCIYFIFYFDFFLLFFTRDSRIDWLAPNEPYEQTTWWWSSFVLFLFFFFLINFLLNKKDGSRTKIQTQPSLTRVKSTLKLNWPENIKSKLKLTKNKVMPDVWGYYLSPNFIFFLILNIFYFIKI